MKLIPLSLRVFQCNLIYVQKTPDICIFLGLSSHGSEEEEQNATTTTGVEQESTTIQPSYANPQDSIEMPDDEYFKSKLLVLLLIFIIIIIRVGKGERKKNAGNYMEITTNCCCFRSFLGRDLADYFNSEPTSAVCINCHFT